MWRQKYEQYGTSKTPNHVQDSVTPISSLHLFTSHIGCIAELLHSETMKTFETRQICIQHVDLPSVIFLFYVPSHFSLFGCPSQTMRFFTNWVISVISRLQRAACSFSVRRGKLRFIPMLAAAVGVLYCVSSMPLFLPCRNDREATQLWRLVLVFGLSSGWVILPPVYCKFGVKYAVVQPVVWTVLTVT